MPWIGSRTPTYKMHNIIKYRQLIASILTVWTGVIIISGVVFMHKEVTSDGHIVTHIHPYDFINKNNEHHHHSDDEIQFLNIVFQGSYIQSDVTAYESPFRNAFFNIPHKVYVVRHFERMPSRYYLRGPPPLV